MTQNRTARAPGSGNVAAIPAFIRADFAGAIRSVLYTMAVIMAVAGVVALFGLRRGLQEDTETAAAEPADQRPGDDPDADLAWRQRQALWPGCRRGSVPAGKKAPPGNAAARSRQEPRASMRVMLISRQPWGVSG